MKHQQKQNSKAANLVRFFIVFIVLITMIMSSSFGFAEDFYDTEFIAAEEAEPEENETVPETSDIEEPDEEQESLLPEETEPEEDMIMPFSVGGVYGGYTVTNIIDGSAEYTINTVDSGKVYEVTGNGDKAIIINNANCVLILTGITRTAAESRLQIKGGSNVTAYLVENTVNTFTSNGTNGTEGVKQAGIFVSSGAVLTIEGPGALKANGGNLSAGIGGIYTSSNTNSSDPCGKVIVNSGVVNATGGIYGAGIGGGFNGKGGTIVISGGTVTAQGGTYSAGIGGGRNGDGGNITVVSGYVEAYGGTYGAGIGGGNGCPGGEISIKGGKVNAIGGGGAGIGGGYQGAGGVISISGGDITATGGGGGAGIGGGRGSSGGTITIHDGVIVSTGGSYGAGIGAGDSGTSSGNPVPGGTITINGGKVTAKGSEAGAGIGGGRHGTGGTITINGGTVAASGAAINGGAGIGGGGILPGQTTGYAKGGNITITGGKVIARAFGSSAGIGGGFNSDGQYINISGGDIDAVTENAGAGIGAGGGSACGDIIITGGKIYAKGSNQAAGIGSGLDSQTGTISISGGIIDATSSHDDSSGVGGGKGSAVNVNITGGNVFSTNLKGKIRVNFNPHNGTENVYLLALKLVDENNVILPDTSMSIDVEKSAGTILYTYHATTNTNGIAYMWLPAGIYDYVMYEPSTGKYRDGRIPVVKPDKPEEYDPATNTGIMTLSHEDPFWGYGTNANSDKKHYGNATINLEIEHTNTGINPAKAIAGVKWFRESVENPVYTQETFDTGFAAADQADKGVSGAGADLDLIHTDVTGDHHLYQMSADTNGRYWIQIHYKGAETGKDIYHAAYLDLDNIYTPLDVIVRDWNASDSVEARGYTKITEADDAPYGVPLDIDGSILENPRLGYDTVTYKRNEGLPSSHWNMNVPGALFETTPTDSESSQIILDNRLPDAADKYFTVNYARNANWGEVTVTKTVDGEYADMTKSFEFTARLTENGTDPWPFLDSIVTSAGTLRPGEDGEVAFTLKHGQSITFENVPTEGYVRIIEEDHDWYKASYEDSKNAGRVNDFDTGDKYLTAGDHRAFDYLNTVDNVIPSGISVGSVADWIGDMLLLIIVSAALAVLIWIRTKKLVA